jgi:hypothetical protein
MAEVIERAFNRIRILACTPYSRRISTFETAIKHVQAYHLTMPESRTHKEPPVRPMLTIVVESPPLIREAIRLFGVVVRTEDGCTTCPTNASAIGIHYVRHL